MPAEADRLMRFLLALRQAGVTDARVLSAMERTPRGHFAPASFAAFAYEDRDLPIGEDQVMTAPTMVARVLTALDVRAGDAVLEIGTGSGFQAAAIGALARKVVTLERRQALAATARGRIGERRLMHVYVHFADGLAGWRQDAPFDRIVVNAAIEAPPPALADQLAAGGLLVAPVAGRLSVLRKGVDGAFSRTDAGPAAFAPIETGTSV